MSNTVHLSEDDIYRTSTQYRLWSYAPEQLTVQRRKTHELATARAKQYLSAHRPNGNATTNGRASIPECLTAEEELRLVRKYGEHIRTVGKRLDWASHVYSTAIQYLKRFYLSNSCMTYPPKEIYKTIMFLASKTEALHLPVSTFAKRISADPESILAPEYKVMQALRFTLDVRHPFRGLKGVLIELLNMVDGLVGLPPGVESTDGEAVQQALFHLKPPEMSNRTRWQKPANGETTSKIATDRCQLAFAAAKDILESAAIVTDAYFLYTPSQLIMAALHIADTPLLLFLLDTKLPTDQPIRPKILVTIETCAEMLAAYDENNGMSKEERAALETKLDACRDPATQDLIKNAGKKGNGETQEEKAQRKSEKNGTAVGGDPFGPSLDSLKPKG